MSNPGTKAMNRVKSAAKAAKALRAGRQVLGMCLVDGEPSWEPVVAIDRRRAQAGHTYHAVTYENGHVRVVAGPAVFWVGEAR